MHMELDNLIAQVEKNKVEEAKARETVTKVAELLTDSGDDHECVMKHLEVLSQLHSALVAQANKAAPMCAELAGCESQLKEAVALASGHHAAAKKAVADKPHADKHPVAKAGK